jgi:F-type H+-transporting ATPase subunit a
MYMLEALIMALQAYVFTLLAAIYIEGALHADSH